MKAKMTLDDMIDTLMEARTILQRAAVAQQQLDVLLLKKTEIEGTVQQLTKELAQLKARLERETITMKEQLEKQRLTEEAIFQRRQTELEAAVVSVNAQLASANRAFNEAKAVHEATMTGWTAERQHLEQTITELRTEYSTIQSRLKKMQEV